MGQKSPRRPPPSREKRQRAAFLRPRILFRAAAAYTSASEGAAPCTVQWGVLSVKGNMEERAQELALYIIENKATVRAAASRFGISKSTVHKDLSERLPAINRGLYQQVKEILNENKAERHIRGGIATRKKYKGM